MHTKSARPVGDMYRSPVSHHQLRHKNKIADTIVDIIPRPKFVPRPVVRGLVGLFGAGFVWRTVKKLMSRSLLFSAVTGGGYFLYKLKFPDNSEQPIPSEEEDDSLVASAQRLIDKIK